MLLRQALRPVRPDLVQAWGCDRGAALMASRLGYPDLVTVQGLIQWYDEFQAYDHWFGSSLVPQRIKGHNFSRIVGESHNPAQLNTARGRRRGGSGSHLVVSHTGRYQSQVAQGSGRSRAANRGVSHWRHRRLRSPGRNGITFAAGNKQEFVKAIRTAVAHPLCGKVKVDNNTLQQMREYLSPGTMAQNSSRHIAASEGKRLGCRDC